MTDMVITVKEVELVNNLWQVQRQLEYNYVDTTLINGFTTTDLTEITTGSATENTYSRSDGAIPYVSSTGFDLILEINNGTDLTADDYIIVKLDTKITLTATACSYGALGTFATSDYCYMFPNIGFVLIDATVGITNDGS